MLWRWDFTVFASITNSCAISTFDNPPSTSRKISRSRRLSVSADIVDHAERHKDRARRRIGLMRPYQDGGFGRMIERQTFVGDAECRAQFATEDVNTGHVARCKQAGRAQPGELPGVGVHCRAFPRRRSHKIKWAHVRPADWKTVSAINGKVLRRCHPSPTRRVSRARENLVLAIATHRSAERVPYPWS